MQSNPSFGSQIRPRLRPRSLLIALTLNSGFIMGNKPAKQESDENNDSYLVQATPIDRGQVASFRLKRFIEESRKQKKGDIILPPPPLDLAYVRWLQRDLARIYEFAPRNPPAIEPPDHYIEFMRLKGWLDVDLDDPDLVHLTQVKNVKK